MEKGSFGKTAVTMRINFGIARRRQVAEIGTITAAAAGSCKDAIIRLDERRQVRNGAGVQRTVKRIHNDAEMLRYLVERANVVREQSKLV